MTTTLHTADLELKEVDVGGNGNGSHIDASANESDTAEQAKSGEDIQPKTPTQLTGVEEYLMQRREQLYEQDWEMRRSIRLLIIFLVVTPLSVVSNLFCDGQ